LYAANYYFIVALPYTIQNCWEKRWIFIPSNYIRPILLWAIMKHHYIVIDRNSKELYMRWKNRTGMCKSQQHRYHISNLHVHVLIYWFQQNFNNNYGRWFRHKLTPSPSDVSPSNKKHVLNGIKLNEIGQIHTNPYWHIEALMTFTKMTTTIVILYTWVT
jgi:hypothetical protein